MAFSSTLLTKSSIINTVTDEEFEEMYKPNEDAIQLVDNRLACEKIRNGPFGCVLGKNSYSSGIHRIRMRADHDGIFLGIRSRHILPVSDWYSWGRYDFSPSTYGWERDYGRICNGRFQMRDLERAERNNHIFVLTLNCDEHRLSMLNENTNEHDEMEVDITHAPFPWCLFVQLPRMKSRISILQSSLPFAKPSYGAASSPARTRKVPGTVATKISFFCIALYVHLSYI